jgi:drug/metabolite transporter (DMT)-like permease
MPSSGRPLDAVATALMIVLCLSWGLNQVAIKLALPDIPPLIQGALRSLGALPVVFVIARLRRVRLTTRDGTLFAGVTVGALFGIEFILIYRGLVWTTASRGVVFVYTAPFFIALGARIFLHERLTPLFGFAAGHFIIGDPLTPTFGVAVILVVAGLVLVNRPR